MPSDADVAKIEAALSAARASAAGAIPTASNSAPSPALPGAGPTRGILSNPELDSILRGTGAQTNATSNDAKSDANYPNKVGHVFDKPEHALDPVLRQFPSAKDAYIALQAAAQRSVGSNPNEGSYQIVVNVGGTNVTITGVVVNGIARIGTAFLEPTS